MLNIMKQFILSFLSLFLLVATIQAQDVRDLQRDAEDALEDYNDDPANNPEQLKKAMETIKQAAEMIENAEKDKTVAEVWLTQARVYNTIATQIVKIRQIKSQGESALGQALQQEVGKMEDLPEVNAPALQASEAFKKALETAEKNSQEKDAIEGFQKVQPNLSNLGIAAYEQGDYNMAFAQFKEVLTLHETLEELGEEGTIKTDEDYQNQLFITGLAALNANNLAMAEQYFMPLYEKGYNEATVYEAMYKIKSKETSPEEAFKYLEEGRKRFPEQTTLLFAEINHYLKIGKLDVLIQKLDQAIEKEPDNLSLYATTGNVYDRLYQKEMEKDSAANLEKAEEYFNNALDYYKRALEKDPDYFDAIYSIGTLYYNKAASMTEDLKAVSDDYSEEGTRKFQEIQQKMLDEFDKALPYFKRCEKINPNDINTLIALKEIYARKDQLDVSNEFKERLEMIESGQEVKKSYFTSKND